MGSTTKELVEDLEKEFDSPYINDNKRMLIREVIKEAKRGQFHDFLTPLAMPKTKLRETLLLLKLENLADKVMNGDYDNESPHDEI